MVRVIKRNVDDVDKNHSDISMCINRMMAETESDISYRRALNVRVCSGEKARYLHLIL